ncbi:hypothetical protein B0H10DRAFT_1963787 [Mycena sp. CBHHK59/15]|nr:hypothetical protein B0H10DRAFT_1963787 [Mycena sp. CBHHK59/15]
MNLSYACSLQIYHFLGCFPSFAYMPARGVTPLVGSSKMPVTLVAQSRESNQFSDLHHNMARNADFTAVYAPKVELPSWPNLDPAVAGPLNPAGWKSAGGWSNTALDCLQHKISEKSDPRKIYDKRIDIKYPANWLPPHHGKLESGKQKGVRALGKIRPAQLPDNQPRWRRICQGGRLINVEVVLRESLVAQLTAPIGVDADPTSARWSRPVIE